MSEDTGLKDHNPDAGEATPARALPAGKEVITYVPEKKWMKYFWSVVAFLAIAILVLAVVLVYGSFNGVDSDSTPEQATRQATTDITQSLLDSANKATGASDYDSEKDYGDGTLEQLNLMEEMQQK